MAAVPPDGFMRCLKTSVTNHWSKSNRQLIDLMFENSVLTAELEESNRLATYGERHVESTEPKSSELDNWRPVDQAIKWEQENSRLPDLNKEGECLEDLKAAKEESLEIDANPPKFVKAVKEGSLEIGKQLEAKAVLTTDRGSQCDIMDPTVIVAIEKVKPSIGTTSDMRETKEAQSSPSPSVTHLLQELEEWGIFNEQRWVEGDNVDFGGFAALQEGLHSLMLK